MDVESRLRDALHEGARDLPMHGRGPEAARRRARRLAHRRRSVPAALTATVVGATAIGVVVARDDDKPATVTAAAPEVATPTKGDMQFDWQSAPATVTINRTVFAGSDGSYYALATAPGTRNPEPNVRVPQSIYRSTDGLNWSAAALGDRWFTDLDERDGVLYALGTAPGTNASGIATELGTSSDGGANWATSTLPTTAHAPAANVEMTLSGVMPQLAVGDGVMIASVRTMYYFDFEQVLSPEERGEGFMTRPVEGGLEVFSMPCIEKLRPDAVVQAVECESRSRATPVRTIPWSEVGITGMNDLNQEEWFISHDDGAHWETIANPAPGADSVEMSWTQGRFFATATNWDQSLTGSQPPVARLFSSADGANWVEASTGIGPLVSVGVVGSTLMAVGQGPSLQIASSDDGGLTWTASSLDSIVDAPADTRRDVYAADIGPLGVAFIVTVSPDFDMKTSETGDPTTPGTLAPTLPEQALVTSTDGSSWTVTPLSNVGDGKGKWIDWITVGANQIVLSATHGGDATEKQASTTYAGTPKR